MLRDGEVLYECLPVEGAVTGGFGALYADGRGGTYAHRGVDSAPPAGRGAAVRAPAGGVVCEFTNSWTTWRGRSVRSFGNAICIDHGQGRWRYTLLAHNDELLVAVTDHVEPGQLVARAGDSGVADGVHCHWQRSDTPTFPVDLARSTDPLAWLATEEELMDNWRTKLLHAADGPVGEMDRAYAYLRPLGFFDYWIAQDGDPDANTDPGWRAMARRSCLRWLATGDRARAAIEALGWTL